MERVSKAIELREKVAQPLAELVELGMVSKAASTNLFDEIGKNIVDYVNDIVNGGGKMKPKSTRDSDKPAQESKIIAEATKPTLASTVKASSPTVLDSPAPNQRFQNAPSQLVLKSPDESVRVGGAKQGGGVPVNNSAQPKPTDGLSAEDKREKERREYYKYRKDLSNMRRLTYPDAPPTVDYTHTFDNAIEPSFLATPPGHEKNKKVTSEMVDEAGQKYDKYGEPIVNEGSATYHVVIDENHPDAMVCPFWLESETSDSKENFCSYSGDHEPYFHKILPGKPLEQLECQFWREGQCCRGSSCPFSHRRTRHGIVKDMNGNATEKFTFTIAGDSKHAGEPGLSSSRYASQSRVQAPVKAVEKPKPTQGWSDQKVDLDQATASFRAQLEGGGRAKQAAVRNQKGAPHWSNSPQYANMPGKPGYNAATYY